MAGGTIDLDWSSLTPDLAERLVGLLNSALSNATRPSFIGPVSVSSFDFGTASPDIELVDVRDIYPDFLEDDEDGEQPGLDTDRSAQERENLLDDFEWVSRREGMQSDVPDDELFDPRYLPPHIRHSREAAVSQTGAALGPQGPVVDDFSHIHVPDFTTNSTDLPRESPGSSVDEPILSNVQDYGVHGAGYPQHGHRRLASPVNGEGYTPRVFPDTPARSRSATPLLPPLSALPPQQPQTEHPDLQLHFRINFESNLRLMINTSLQINYPSPMIMALPIKLGVIGLVLEGELVVACEGSRKRIHVCFLDDLVTHGGGPVSASACGNHDSKEFPAAEEGRTPKRFPSSNPRLVGTPSRPSPAGTRLLPSILLESEIGQEDKHVLRNVARVERFVQDVIRKTVEEELVYPNFQTIVL